MRRIIVFLVVLISLVLAFTPVSEVASIAKNDSIKDVIIYQTTKTDKEFLTVDNVKIYEASGTISDAISRIKDKDVVAITIKIEGDYDVNKMLKKFRVEVKSTQNISNKKIIYAYSNLISGYNLAINKKTNLQIVSYDNKIIVGIPLIVGSF